MPRRKTYTDYNRSREGRKEKEKLLRRKTMYHIGMHF